MATYTSGASLEPPKKRVNADFTADITVLVGKKEKRYVVHKNIITGASELFCAACKGEWKESKERVVRLPEVDSDTFEVWLAFLYTDEVDANINDEAADAATLLIKCFALGELVQDVRFRNSVVDKYLHTVESDGEIAGPYTIQLLCEVVHSWSTMMRLCVDYASFDTTKASFDVAVKEYPSQLVTSIAKAAVRDLDRCVDEEKKPYDRGKCHYHEHPDGKGNTKACFDPSSSKEHDTLRLELSKGGQTNDTKPPSHGLRLSLHRRRSPSSLG